MIEFFLSLLRLSIPLIFASLGGLFSERSGVINIALEGMMLFGAFIAAVIALKTDSPMLAFVIAGISGGGIGLFYALVVIRFRANQIVAGTAMNLLMMGLIPLLLKLLYDSTGASPSLSLDQRFEMFPLWFVWIICFFVWYIVNRLPYGLWLRVAGEKPEALDAAGISVNKVRYSALFFCGILAAWGGACLSIFLSSGYSRNMVAGRGFMALAALIFGKWSPMPVLLACLFFGLMDAVQIQLQSMEHLSIPAEFVQMIPYITTIFILAGFVGRSKAPKAIGTVFETK